MLMKWKNQLKRIAAAVAAAAIMITPIHSYAFPYAKDGLSMEIPDGSGVYYYTPDGTNMTGRMLMSAQEKAPVLMTGVYGGNGVLSYSLKVDREEASAGGAGQAGDKTASVQTKAAKLKESLAEEYSFSENREETVAGRQAAALYGDSLKNPGYGTRIDVLEDGGFLYTVTIIYRKSGDNASWNAAAAQLATLKLGTGLTPDGTPGTEPDGMPGTEPVQEGTPALTPGLESASAGTQEYGSVSEGTPESGPASEGVPESGPASEETPESGPVSEGPPGTVLTSEGTPEPGPASEEPPTAPSVPGIMASMVPLETLESSAAVVDRILKPLLMPLAIAAAAIVILTILAVVLAKRHGKGGEPGGKGGKPGGRVGKPDRKGGKPDRKGGKPGGRVGKSRRRGGKPGGEPGGKPGGKPGGEPGGEPREINMQMEWSEKSLSVLKDLDAEARQYAREALERGLALEADEEYIAAAKKFRTCAKLAQNKAARKTADLQTIKCLVLAEEYDAALVLAVKLLYEDYDYTAKERKSLDSAIRMLEKAGGRKGDR